MENTIATTATTQITVNQLINILRKLPNNIGQFVNVTQVTEPKVLKKDRVTKDPNPFTKVLKISNLTVLISTDYAKGVENQLVREGKDKSEYEKGRNTMPLDFSNSANTFFGEFTNSKGQYMGWALQYRPFEKSYPVSKYVADGNMKSKSNLPDILPVSSPATNQGTDKEILWRKLYVQNIRRININGIRYKVVNE